MLIGSILWFLLVLWVFGLELFTAPWVARIPQPDAVGRVLGFFIMILAAFTTIAGSLAMLRRGSRQTAWAGAIVALIPCFGPCYGLLIPFAIWAITILRRKEVSSRFRG
jgi:hypothetical protein